MLGIACGVMGCAGTGGGSVSPAQVSLVVGPPAAGPKDAVEADVREVVFRDLLSGGRRGETCFLSFGTAADGRWIEVPEAFLKRFADLKVSPKHVSQARIPDIGEMEPGGTRMASIRDTASGQRGNIYWVKIAGWTNDDECEIEAGRLGGGLDGGGYSAVVRREKGKWVIDKSPGGVHRSWAS